MSKKRRKSRSHGIHPHGPEDATSAGATSERDEAATETGIDPSPGAGPAASDADAEAGAEAESGSPSAPDVETELERAEAEAAEMRELAQRTRAEFENYRKRMERERADLVRHAGFEVVREVLPVLDNLERAIRASESSPEEQFRAGVEIIHRQFREILTRLGLTEVESQGKPFDPHLHEAVSRVETTQHPEGTVVEVFQKGYAFKDRLVRPAMVAVAQSPPGGGADGDGSSPEDEGEVVRKSE